MKYSAVIDTNVLVSALLSPKNDSATVQVIEKVLKREITIFYSDEILNEYTDVLNRKKFNFSKATVDYLIDAIKTFGILKNPSDSEIILPDMKDVPFYKIIVEDEESYLVTGNIKHFPKSSRIITAREMINLIENLN